MVVMEIPLFFQRRRIENHRGRVGSVGGHMPLLMRWLVIDDQAAKCKPPGGSISARNWTRPVTGRMNSSSWFGAIDGPNFRLNVRFRHSLKVREDIRKLLHA